MSVEPAVTLPHEWQKKTLGLKPAGPESLIINFLQEYIQKHSSRAIEVKAIQLLAKWATELDRPDDLTPFPFLRELLSDLEKRAGPWVIESVIGERKRLIKNTQPIELSRELDACIAEWQVLHYLLQRDWSAVKRQRNSSDYDWFVTQSQGSIAIEVKQKAAIGSASQALEWCLSGLSLLPEGSWIYKYNWNCRLPRTTRFDEVRPFADELSIHLTTIEGAIDGELEKMNICEDSHAIPGTKLLIEAQLPGNRPAIKISLPAAPHIRLIVEPTDNPNYFSISGDNSDYVLPELRDCEADEILTLLSRLDAAKQGAKRPTDGLYVFVWWLPFAWEDAYKRDAYKREWLRKTCDQMAQQSGLKYIAVWPRGYFTAAHEPWTLSTKAMVDFPELAL